MKKLMLLSLLTALTVSSVGCQTCGGGLFNRRNREWQSDGCETCCESSMGSYDASFGGGEVIVPGPSRIVPGPSTRVLPAPE